MLRQRLALIAVAVVTLIASCKQGPQVTASGTKDFAYIADAKNFAIVAGSRPSDLEGVKVDTLNWNNMLTKGHLGTFQVIYTAEAASAADVAQAFQKIGSQLTPDSTVLFAYSGSVTADGTMQAGEAFTLGQVASGMMEAAKAAGTSQAARLYLFIDASGPADRAKAIANVKELTTTDDTQRFFKQIVEFTADSKTMNGTDYSGRLSYEFVKTLDQSIANFRANKTNPTLEQFFGQVTAATQANSERVASYFAFPKAMLQDKFFSANFNPGPDPVTGGFTQAQPPSYEPPVITPPASTAVNPPATVPTATSPTATTAPSSFDTAKFSQSIQGSSGSTTLAQVAKGSHMLIELSAEWCGPCRRLASDLAQREGKTNCGVITIVGQGELANWTSRVQQEYPSEASAVAAHSYEFAGKVDQIASDFGGSVPYFPTLLLVDSKGTLVAQGEEQARASFANFCQ